MLKRGLDTLGKIFWGIVIVWLIIEALEYLLATEMTIGAGDIITCL